MVTVARPRHRILVVDDEAQIARSIARLLKAHDVIVATTAAEGIALARTGGFELVVCDFYLPDGTGKDVIGALRETSRAPVLLMSGAVDIEAWAEWAFFAADDFLPKPFPPEQLRAKVERLLTNFDLEQTSARQHAELAALHEANEREAEAAHTLLDRMTQRSRFDPARVKVESISAGQFGGDVVMGQDLPDGRSRWLIGDVSGHTLASALVTIPISLIFYALTQRGTELSEMCRTMDRELSAMLPVSMFFAATACELDREAGTLRIVNAGCPDVLIKRTHGDVDAYGSTEPPFGIGIMDVAPVTIPVAPGDQIYAYTDGLIEHCRDDGILFGAGRVRELVARGGFQQLSAAWRDYAPGQGLADDLSIIEVTV